MPFFDGRLCETCRYDGQGRFFCRWIIGERGHRAIHLGRGVVTGPPDGADHGLEASGVVLDQAVNASILDMLGRDGMLGLFDQLSALMRSRFDKALLVPEDRRRLAEEAHTMISPAGMLGFTSLSALCRDLERACESKDDLGGLIKQVRAARVAVSGAIEDFKRAA